MYFEKEKFIKSPLNYVGGKFKLLDQLFPLLPDDIETFYDLFTGGANISVNVQAKRIIANDTQTQVIEFLTACKLKKSQEMLAEIDALIKEYNLSKTNAEGFYALRKAYNNGQRNWATFYTLVCYAFNNMIRFNRKEEYTYSHGLNRSSFNPTLRQNFISFVDELKNKNIMFFNQDFKTFDITTLHPNDFVYLDPPYLITGAAYNKTWGTKEEQALLDLLDQLNQKGIRFALSNVLEHKGKSNELLKKWSKNYNVNHLDYNYNNCIFCSRGSSQEVLITNYKLPETNKKAS